MKCKRVWVTAGLLLLVAVAYLAGYSRGHSIAERDATRFGIASHLGVYLAAEAGDLKGIKNSSGTILYGHTKWYEQHFAGENESEGFQTRLNEARKIAAQVKTNMVVIDRKKIIEDFNRENAKPKPGAR